MKSASALIPENDLETLLRPRTSIWNGREKAVNPGDRKAGDMVDLVQGDGRQKSSSCVLYPTLTLSSHIVSDGDHERQRRNRRAICKAQAEPQQW